MPYLFDTNVTIYYINGVPATRQLFTDLAPEGVSISIVVYMEVLDGIPGSPNPQIASQRFGRLIEHIPLLGFGRAEADRCVEIRQQLRDDGKEWRRRAVDLMVAATAIEHNVVLISNNPRDYNDIIGLEFEDPAISPR